MNNCAFYCVSYNSPERAATMRNRFAQIGADLHIHTGVQMDDPRLQYTDDLGTKRLWSVCYGHIDNMAAFLKTDKKYGFTCEDDVHIHKELGTRMPEIQQHFDEMDLDILLLGYMTTFPILDWYSGYDFRFPYDPARRYQYHNYPDGQWGIHLAMFSRAYAQRVVETYGGDYAQRSLVDPSLGPFNPDWTITKLTHKRALMYPMMAVEDGKGKYDHWGQGEFHRESHRANYREGEFL